MHSSVERIDNPHVAVDIAVVGKETNSMFQCKQQAAMNDIRNGASVGYDIRQYPLDNLTMLKLQLSNVVGNCGSDHQRFDYNTWCGRGSNRAASPFEGFERNGSERSDQEASQRHNASLRYIQSTSTSIGARRSDSAVFDEPESSISLQGPTSSFYCLKSGTNITSPWCHYQEMTFESNQKAQTSH
ncbi:hypothetical protein G6F43_009258 [Rhizopus delemar]|nr:hypothetical protein G6F43_009258 [Rhizopus delemar]